MNKELMFSSKSDEWETPQELFDSLNDEFKFEIDVCATVHNRKCRRYFGIEDDGLSLPWHEHASKFWMNPPYSNVAKWIEKAHNESQKGCTVVCLVPSRTDTRWFHNFVWNKENHKPRDGVEIRFVKGRLKFGNSKNSAPFPSMIVIFRPVKEGDYD